MSAPAPSVRTPARTDLGSELVPRDPAMTRAWDIWVNGERLTDLIGGPVLTLQIDCRNNAGELMGTVNYGAQPNSDGTPSTYDTWSFTSPAGATILPWCHIDGELYVGGVLQERHLERHRHYAPTGCVWNAPRGMDLTAVGRSAAAKAELGEEVGNIPGRIVRAAGTNVTMDSAWFAHTDELEDGKPVRQGGVSFFSVKVNPEILEKQPDDSYKFPDAVAASRRGGDKIYEKLGTCVFVPWKQAARSRDSFTAIAVARLIADLSDCEMVYIDFYPLAHEEGDPLADAADRRDGVVADLATR